MAAGKICVGIVLVVSLATTARWDLAAAEIRSFDGTGNNLGNPTWGSAGTNFVRHSPIAYTDLVSRPDIAGRPNPRSVSVALFQQTAPNPSVRNLSGYVYAFGQLLSHEMQHSVAGGDESIGFATTQGDDIFFPGQFLGLTRSVFDPATGDSPANPRQQVNFTTAYIDASVIYGSDELTASVLRGGPSSPGAKLRTSNDINGDAENLLPRNAFGPNPDADFVAGDSRVNDNIVLTSLHTVFMREHNRLVDELVAAHPDWTDEQLFQRARAFVGAQLQAITYNEFLPAMLGPHAPSPDGLYDPTVDASVINEFPAVFLRAGHSMLPDAFLRVENDGRPAPEGSIFLEDAFFNPAELTTSRDVDLLLKGLTVEVQEETDLLMTFGVRVALLGAIDIQRARDHGLPDYNTMREAYGLPRFTSFAEITPDPEVQQKLEQVYGDVDSIDALVGALAEPLLPDASVGTLLAAGLREQFIRARDGDRFWYQGSGEFTPAEIDWLRGTTLADLIRRNTGVENIPDNVFFADPTRPVPEPAGVALLAALGVWKLRRRVRC